jgi:hypothetical protein
VALLLVELCDALSWRATRAQKFNELAG